MILINTKRNNQYLIARKLYKPNAVTKFNTFKSAEGVKESEIYMDPV